MPAEGLLPQYPPGSLFDLDFLGERFSFFVRLEQHVYHKGNDRDGCDKANDVDIAVDG